MKLFGIYIGVFLLGLGSFFLMIGASISPESLILGKWKETKWEYEKMDKSPVYPDKRSIDSDVIKQISGENLLIHKSETWHFYPDGRLVLTGGGMVKTAEWRIKGRGHILQLRHANKTVENYNIDVLNNNALVLNFEADLEVRGIAKLTFNRTKK